MASRINRLPWGLQDFLGSTSQGDNPSELLQQVRPTADMWPLWGMERLDIQTASNAAAAAVDASAQVEIPNNELWIPFVIGGRADFTTIGDQLATTIQMINPENTISISLAESPLLTAVQAGGHVRSQFTFPFPIAFQSSWGFLCSYDQFNVAAGARQINVSIMYWRLAI